MHASPVQVLLGCFITVWMTGAAPAQRAQPGDELILNGTFELKAAKGNQPADWRLSGGARWEADGKHYRIVEETAQPTSLSASQHILLGDDYWKVRLACNVKVTGVKQGDEGWHDARIAMSFHDKRGKMVGSWPNVLHFTGTMADWESHERDFVVPEGAAYLELNCSLLSTTGRVEWENLSLRLLKHRPAIADAVLPSGVEARWDLASAFREETPTRGRVCINGLWKFHAATVQDRAVPVAGSGWGYLKVPGTWNPATSRTRVILPEFLEDKLNLSQVDAAWYQRAITIPPEWAGRRILLDLDNPKQTARVLVDGREAGTVEWPGGRVDITALVKPGGTHLLSIYTLALPIQGEQLVVMGPTQMEKARAEVKFKGLAGDCFLVSEPVGPHIADVFIQPSVRRGELRVQCELAGTNTDQRFQLEAIVYDGHKVVKKITGDSATLVGPWPNPKLWDLDQPNLYHLGVRLTDAGGQLFDETTPVLFGFREFWIQGRDFYLNGKPFHLRCLDLSHPADFAQAACEQVKTAFARARGLGFNYVIHSHYDYDPQSFAYIADTLRAGDEAGFPMSYTIRHVKQIYRDFEKPEKRSFWDHVVDYEVKQVRNHPSVLMWAMNHNFCGWPDDQNPARLDGIYAPQPGDNKSLTERRKAAALAERYVMALDGTRPAYHHESGNFGQMITLNCYLNWTPLQERMEWPARWATNGVKPLFFVEFGLPHQASWGGHRTGPFIWRNKVSSEPLPAEFSAIYNAADAYQLADYEIEHISKIEKVYARHEPFHITDVLGAYWNNHWEHNYLQIKSAFTEQTWPAFRTWGVSAILPWDQEDLFKPSLNANPQAVELPTDYAHLQQPGVAPDFQPWSDDWLRTPKFEGNFEDTSLAKIFRRVNRETLAYLAGPPQRFTAKDHIFSSGETVTKQVALINDLRGPAQTKWAWSVVLDGKAVANGKGEATLDSGSRALLPFSFELPAVNSDAKGAITLHATFNDQSDETLQDTFAFDVLPAALPPASAATIACYDPQGLTSKLLRGCGQKVASVVKPACPPGCKLLVIGREALTLNGPAPDIEMIVRGGANVLVFEQAENVLQKRWGFRTASPGTRHVFMRQPGHPVCRGITDELLRDWRGSATLLDPYPQQEGYNSGYQKQEWCGFLNTRTWRWGACGTVASVVLEKPQRGNWSSILDCEFDLQYSPLLEWLTPNGRVIFSQLDFSGRDANDPAAGRLLANLLAYAQSVPPSALGGANFLGGIEHKDWLQQLGLDPNGGKTLIIAPGADATAARTAVSKARTVICLGLTGDLLKQVLPFPVQTEDRFVTHTLIGTPMEGALLGLGDGDFHWRGRLSVPALIETPPEFHVVSTGVFAEGNIAGKHYVFVQFLPTQFDWKDKPYLKLSCRRALISIARILTNCGVHLGAPVAELLAAPADTPVGGSGQTGRWLNSFYLDKPTTLDDPYRYERW